MCSVELCVAYQVVLVRISPSRSLVRVLRLSRFVVRFRVVTGRVTRRGSSSPTGRLQGAPSQTGRNANSSKDRGTTITTAVGNYSSRQNIIFITGRELIAPTKWEFSSKSKSR
jgi:hypothetical protein